MTATDLHPTIDAVWRMESPALIASLTRIDHDTDFAADLAQDALVAALEQWPESGIPQTRALGSWRDEKPPDILLCAQLSLSHPQTFGDPSVLRRKLGHTTV